MRDDDRRSDDLGSRLMPGDPADGEDQDPAVGKRLGRYELLEFIGSGGMARVYKARDLVLGRIVAVKVLHGDDPSLGARFMNEARAQARVEHENICKVFEVGEEDGRRYIALQYISGLALDAAAPQMSLEQKVRVLMQVADTVQGAHRLGLIHRGLKPSNIMVERSESGVWKPYVLDFGLVRDQAAPGLTSTGAILGTPAYMSPEQALGDWGSVGPRADVYGLGVTLYELLVGRPPFCGTTYEIVRALMESEPPSPRSIDSRIPADLNTIVMKCLEKEPSRRYESASALAEDLRRYLNGELIAARPSTLRHRLIKKAGKNKALVRVILAATMLLAAAGGIGGYAFWRARKLVEYSQYFTQRAKEMESIMRQAYARPLHDIRPERKMVLNRITLVEEEIARTGTLAEGPGRYALGRGFLVLRQYEKAYEQLQRAWDSGFRDPEIGYCLGLALGELYKRALEDAQREASKTLQQEKQKQAKVAYCDAALHCLKLSADVPGVAPAYILLAQYEFVGGGEGRAHAEQAIVALRKAEALTPGNTAIQYRLATAFRILAEYELRDGDDPSASSDRSIACSRRAIDVAPNDPSLWLTLAEVLRWKAEWEVAAGAVGAAGGIERGIATAQRAAEAKACQWEALALIGAFDLLRARVDRDRARRERTLDLARQELQQAIDHDRFLAHDYGPLLDQAAGISH